MAGKSYQLLIPGRKGQGRGLGLDFPAVYVTKVKEGDEGVSSAFAASKVSSDRAIKPGPVSCLSRSGMIHVGKEVKTWSVRYIQEQGFTFKSVVNVNTHFIKTVQLSGFDLTFSSYSPMMLLLADFRRWKHCNTALRNAAVPAIVALNLLAMFYVHFYLISVIWFTASSLTEQGMMD